MKTKILSTVKIAAILILLLFLSPSIQLSAQNADNILVKNFRPVSIYKIPVTHIERAAYPIFDIHSHDYAKTEEDVAQWV